MAEITLDLRSVPRARAYEELAHHIDLVLEGIDDEIAEMATVSALVHHAFGFLWTGFYRVVKPNALMRVGPYQGTLGCMEISFDRGVCGAAARERRAVIVEDVNAFPGHVACDARARSEIALPVENARGDLRAVLDIDSELPGTFGDSDAEGLSRILARFSRRT